MTRNSLRALVPSTLAVSLVLASCGGGGGGGGGTPPPVDPIQSTFTVTPAFGTSADGVGAVQARVVLADAAGNPLPGRRVVLEAAGFANALTQPAKTDGTGATTGALRTTVGEKKTLVAVIDPGPTEVRMGPVTAEFLRIQPNWRFVRASGSDANDGRTPLTAWATLARALPDLAPGDVLHVGAGTYGDALSIAMAASADAPLVIRGDRAGEFTGDAGEILLDVGGAAAAIELAGATGVQLRGLSIRGAVAAIRATGARDCAILDCRLYENALGIELDGTSDVLVEANRVTSNTGDALRVAATARTRVLANLVYGNGGDGLELGAASSDLTVQWNTFHANGGDQLRETLAGNTGLVGGNVMTQGLGRGLGLAAGTALTTGANLSWLQTSNSPESSISADPLLANPAGADGILGNVGAEDDDFRVPPGSPALDAAAAQARTVELALAGSLTALGTRTDGARDGRTPDLAAAHLGFHYPLPLDAFASLEARGARAAWAGAADALVRTRAWGRDANAWGAAKDTQALGSEVRWLVQRVSSGPKPEELLAAQIDTGAGTFLMVRAWDARRWSDDAPAVLSKRIAFANKDERGFDAEYEGTSGDALLVYADGASNVLARTLSDGAWSAAAPVFAPALHTGTVLWTELVPRPGTNEIALVALDDQQRLAAAIWDGTQWTRAILLATQVNSLRDFKAFDAAWESLSGDLLVAWGYSQFAEETRYATLSRTTNTWTTGQFVSTDALGMFLALSSDPTSNRIVGIFGEGNSDDDVGVSVWSGSSWNNTAEMSLLGAAQSRAMEIGWLGNRGLAFAVWRDQALTGAFQWATLNSGGWHRQSEVALPGVGRMVQAETRTIPGTDRVMMLLLDDAGAVWAIEHDGASWILANGGAPLATGLDPANAGRAFDFDLRAL